MIKYLKNSEIDFNKWDDCINNSINGLVYAYSWYLDIVCEKWEALIDEDYNTVFPLTFSKKAGIHYLFQPVFTQQLGIFSRKILTEIIVDEFLQAIPNKYKLTEINLNSFNKVDDKKYNYIYNRNHVLDLINSYEYIYKNYSQNIRRNIKNAKKSGVLIIKNNQPDEIIKMFRENRGKKIGNLSDNNYKTLKQLILTCIHKNIGEIWSAYTERNELCAGAFFIKSLKRAIFIFSATNQKARENNAMSLIIDEFIKENTHHELTLDFEGSNNDNLARFYNSFGSKRCTYIQLRTNKLNPVINFGVNLVKQIKQS